MAIEAESFAFIEEISSEMWDLASIKKVFSEVPAIPSHSLRPKASFSH